MLFCESSKNGYRLIIINSIKMSTYETCCGIAFKTVNRIVFEKCQVVLAFVWTFSVNELAIIRKF